MNHNIIVIDTRKYLQSHSEFINYTHAEMTEQLKTSCGKEGKTGSVCQQHPALKTQNLRCGLVNEGDELSGYISVKDQFCCFSYCIYNSSNPNHMMEKTLPHQRKMQAALQSSAKKHFLLILFQFFFTARTKHFLIVVQKDNSTQLQLGPERCHTS